MNLHKASSLSVEPTPRKGPSESANASLVSSHYNLKERKIVFYTDARNYGGHEVASLHALECMLVLGAHVVFVSRDSNKRLNDHITAFKREYGSLVHHRLEVPPLKYPDLLGFFYRRYLSQLRRVFNQACPEIIFVSQGNIGISWAGMRVAWELNIPCMSYIPMAYPQRKLLGAKGYLRDAFSHQVIHWPNYWLTCTEAQRSRLRERGVRKPIDVLPNPITIQSFRSRDQARIANQLPENVQVIGMVGRLNNRQKGCDLFLNALLQASSDSPLRKAWLLFIGEGRVYQEMRSTLERAGWRGKIRSTGWTEVPSEHYSALDLLVMPSRFEGQPLAMQEALLSEVPVCGTKVEGLAGYLPDEWLCPPENPSKLCDKMESMLLNHEQHRPYLSAAAERIKIENNIDQFFARLKSALDKVVRVPNYTKK